MDKSNMCLTSLNLLVLHTVDGCLVDPIQPVVKLQDHPFALPASPTHTLCCTVYLPYTHVVLHCLPLTHTHCVALFTSHTHTVFLFTSHTHAVLHCLPPPHTQCVVLFTSPALDPCGKVALLCNATALMWVRLQL